VIIPTSAKCLGTTHYYIIIIAPQTCGAIFHRKILQVIFMQTVSSDIRDGMRKMCMDEEFPLLITFEGERGLVLIYREMLSAFLDCAYVKLFDRGSLLSPLGTPYQFLGRSCLRDASKDYLPHIGCSFGPCSYWIQSL
jgi:hypothetical protein